MELQEFLEKFASNDDEKALSKAVLSTLEKEYEIAFYDLRKNFKYAMQNFTDIICEKQIRICVETIEDCYDAAFDSLGISELSLEHMPLDFEKAKIESL